LLVKGIGPERKGKEIGIIFLQVMHVFQPLDDQHVVYPADINGEVPLVIFREVRKILPVLEFLSEVKDSLEELGEGFMLEQQLVFQQADQEIFI
jgi:hypothetical protein